MPCESSATATFTFVELFKNMKSATPETVIKSRKLDCKVKPLGGIMAQEAGTLPKILIFAHLDTDQHLLLNTIYRF